MNTLRLHIKQQDRKYATLARLLKIPRNSLHYKIDHDVFTDEQCQVAADWLGVPIGELFPESEPVSEVEA